MTIIAVKDGIMAADSGTFSGAMRARPVPGFSKIARSIKGLVGCAGSSGDCAMLREWFVAGADFSNPPTFTYTDPKADDAIDWLWLKPDGTLWRGNPKMLLNQVEPPYTIGQSSAAYVANGAMAFGASAAKAVQIAIDLTVYVSGPVRVEALEGAALHVAA